MCPGIQSFLWLQLSDSKLVDGATCFYHTNARLIVIFSYILCVFLLIGIPIAVRKEYNDKPDSKHWLERKLESLISLLLSHNRT